MKMKYAGEEEENMEIYCMMNFVFEGLAWYCTVQGVGLSFVSQSVSLSTDDP
jgi:hypothetical protein